MAQSEYKKSLGQIWAELRMSGASGVHQDRRQRRKRTREAKKRQAIRESKDGE